MTASPTDLPTDSPTDAPADAQTGTPLTPAQAACLEALIAEHQGRPGATLPLLHAVQETLGYIPRAAVAQLAQALHISRAQLHGVLGFYHHFRTQAPQPRQWQLCRAEACQSMGGEALWQHACQRLGLDAAGGGGVNAALGLGLQSVYCLGLCACAPALLRDGQLHGRVQLADVDAWLAAAEEAP